MATVPYIILAPSTGSPAYWFRVVQGGYKPQHERKQSVNETIDGGLDVSQGGNYMSVQYLFKVLQQDTSGSPFGTLDNLITFWEYNNPNGSPSDKLTLTDHYGATHTVIFVGNLEEEALTTTIEGPYAWFFVPVTLKYLT